MDEKRTIDGHTVLHAVRIDGAEQIVAEKDGHYRLYRGERVSTLGIEEYATVFENSDYLKAMREFTRRINVTLDGLSLDRVYRGSPVFKDYPLTTEDCVKGGMNADLRGKVLAVKTEVLSPEFRTQSHQLMLATGGFGCAPDARGQSVFATNLYSGEENRWDRSDILGVVAEDALPAWAQEELIKLRKPINRESVIEKIRDTKAAKPAPEQEHKAPKPHKSKPER